MEVTGNLEPNHKELASVVVGTFARTSIWEFAKIRGPTRDSTRSGSYYKDTQDMDPPISRNSTTQNG